MVLTSKNTQSKLNEFFSSAVLSTLNTLLKPEDALFLTRALVSKKSKAELLDFLQSPVIAVDGENSVLVDNKFLKRQLLESNRIDILEQLPKAKIIVKNCSNIGLKGLDVIYLLNNTVRLIAPDDEQAQKNEIFLAKDNKVITTVNTTINFSISNSFKTMLHTTIDNMKNTRIVNKSSTCIIPQVLEEQLSKSIS